MNSFRVLKPGLIQQSICIILALSMATAPSMNVLAQTNDASQPKQKAASTERTAGTIDTKYVTPGADALVVFRPAQLMKSPMSELLPTEVATAAGLKYLGIDPANVEEVSLAFEQRGREMPYYELTLRFIQPFGLNNLPQQLRAHTQPGQLAGKSYLKSQQPMLPSFFAPDARTLLVAPDAMLVHMVEWFEFPTTPKAGPIIDRVRNVAGGNDLYVAIDVQSLLTQIQIYLTQGESGITPDLKPLLDAAYRISAVELTLNLSKAAPSSLVVHANDEEAAKQVETIIADLATKYREKIKAQFARQAASEDPVERAVAQYMERVSGRWSKPLMPTREGARLTFFRIEGSNSPERQLTAVAVIGVLAALLLPATQAAHHAARRTQSMNNMKELMLALLLHEDQFKKFPAHATYTPDGQPLLSWRVKILPFIEQNELYSQFHLDEPWNSKHNVELVARMPKVFENPDRALPPGKTNYLAVIGKECVFDGTANGISMRNISDGTSNTIVIVEANTDRAVEWTRPDDFVFDAKKPTSGLGGLRSEGWLAGFADGHIQFVTSNTDPNRVKAMFTRNGGERLNDEFNQLDELAFKPVVQTQLDVFKSAANLYRFHTKKYPATLGNLINAPDDPSLRQRWAGPYLDSLPKDPWGNEYKYVAPGKHNVGSFDVWSVGRDGKDGTVDDIGNW